MTVTWRVEVVTREPSGGSWNVHVVSQQIVQANTMTEIQLVYSGISSAALKMVAQVSIIAMVDRQSFTGYISGIIGQNNASPHIPLAPSLVSPVNGAVLTNPSVIFSWTSSVGASSYQIQVNDSTNILASVSAPSYSSMFTNGSYSWNVRAYNSNGYGGWSSVWRFTVSIPKPPGTNQTMIWDDCTTLTAPQRYWMTDIAQATLSINKAVESPLGTGSIKVSVPATSFWNLYIDEWFSSDAGLLKDFTSGSRPMSVFVKPLKTIDVTVQVIDRSPSGQGWNTYDIAKQTIQANTMTELKLSYSSISDSSLGMICGIAVIFRINQQSFTGYLSGITASNYSQPIPPPTNSTLSWDFENHTFDHPDMTTLTASQIGWEITQVNSAFAAHNLPYPAHFSLPFGNYNEFVESELSKYCVSSRTAWATANNGLNPYPIANWYEVQGLEIRRTTTWPTIQGWIDAAIANKDLLCMYTHEISSDSNAYEYPWGCTPEILYQTLNYLAQKQNSGQLLVMTMNQAYNYWSTAKSQPIPTVVVSFDDSHETDYTVAYPMFKALGLAGTSYIQVNMLGLTGRLNWAEMAKMASWS